jgi:hypothetical protein
MTKNNNFVHISPINRRLTTNEDIFNEQGELLSYVGMLKENRMSQQNKKMDPRFSKKHRCDKGEF